MRSKVVASFAMLEADDTAGLPIAVVERETGLGKDTLRVWERRYGFPCPARDASGARIYSPAQLRQLQLISRLLALGLRPGKIVGLPLADLQALLSARAPSKFTHSTQAATPSVEPLIASLLDAIDANDSQALRHGLSHAQLSMGLAHFVIDLVAPLTTAVGEAWAQGRFEVYEEHLYTEAITGVLRHAIVSLASQPQPQGPVVLLTTIPQEQHGLGLLMVEALLALEGCTCVSLGTQTPLADIVQAASAHRADVVALSFSNVHKAAVVQASLRELRAQLPAATSLWVGGASTALVQSDLAGVSVLRHLSEVVNRVAQWRLDVAQASIGNAQHGRTTET